MYKKVAVIGADTMGAGIAQVLAAAYIDVLLIDIKTEFVEKGLKKIAGKLKSDAQKRKLALKRIYMMAFGHSVTDHDRMPF